ncbi:MAG: type II toxin-antitoxin system RelE/ParE family toxin [Candidatus Paceibacterota bacterium]|jgi:phage-related protein
MEDIDKYEAILVETVKDFVSDLDESESGKVMAHMDMMQMAEFDAVHTKLIKNPIKELIVGKYRFLFFIEKRIIYFIHAFMKKTQKTPRREIQYAEKIYKILRKK